MDAFPPPSLCDFELMHIPVDSSNCNWSPSQVPHVPLMGISLHVPGHFGPSVGERCPEQDIESDLYFDDGAVAGMSGWTAARTSLLLAMALHGSIADVLCEF